MIHLKRLLREWGGAAAVRLALPLAALMGDSTYVRAWALKIESIARDAAEEWPVRRVAALMLESALARIGDRKERRFWLARLKITDGNDSLREGYAAGVPLERQLWRRLDRLRRLHRLLIASRHSDVALRDYLRASELECRITLARYLFTVEEVIAQIENAVRRSEGIPDHQEYGEFRGEGEYASSGLPAMEQAIVRHLAHNAVIRWASPSTPSAIGSLVGQPIGTVVLTIRPPGSTHEIEIKRAGRRRPLPLDVVWKRNGQPVVSVHHLDGGSELNSLAYEAESASFFSRVFREVHGIDAAMSRSLTVARIDTVPTTGDDADLMEYFNGAAVFGDRFYEMRWNLYHAVRAFTDGKIAALDDAGLTREFIRNTKPAQSIQIDTTALRLDRLHSYLGPKGAEVYFGEGLGVEHGPDDDRCFADQLLDEILAVYEPPRAAWRSYGRYVEAALRVPGNRARADRTYVSLLEQIGRFWGTLLGIRGYSRGESFVERNVGLCSVWADGRWQVRIVFMDHDSLAFGTLDTTTFRPLGPLQNMILDADHILGGVMTEVDRRRGEIGCLRQIYRVSASVHYRGMAAMRRAMKSAYDRTLDAVRRKPALAAMFPQAIVPRMRDWDDAVRGYLQAKSSAAQERWSTALQAAFLLHGYDAAAIAEYVTTIRSEGWFLRRLAFLFARRRLRRLSGAQARDATATFARRHWG